MNWLRKVLSVSIFVLVCGFGFSVQAATFSLSPAVGSYSVGDTFTVTIMLDTEGESVDGVDINALNYNPKVLDVVDALPEFEGTQIAPGALMQATVLNSINEESGRIMFSQVTGADVTYTSTSPQPLATVTFKARTQGNAMLVFNYRNGDTTDANVAAVGADVLRGVINGRYEVSDSVSLGSSISRFVKDIFGF
jgi:hypothetical protein